MLNSIEVEEAVDLQRRSYALLRWVSEQIRKEKLDFSYAHGAASASEAAAEWIGRHWHNLPEKIRPRENQIERFACIFASYLKTSFKLVESRGETLVSDCRCYCSWCAYLGRANQLQVKSVTKSAKRSAEELKRVYLNRLAQEQGINLTAVKIEALIGDRALQSTLALATYGRELVRRTQFASQGEGVLALWRQFAWNEQGVIRGFELSAASILNAERAIVAKLA